MKNIVLLFLLSISLSICIKNKHKLSNKIKSQSKLRVFNALKFVRLNIMYGKCSWNTTEMPDQEPNYPKSLKSFYKFMDRNCLDNDDFANQVKKGLIKSTNKVDCLDKQSVRDKAVCTALQQTLKNPDSSIYYVNTRKIQKGDHEKTEIKRDFLNQFTFAILPKNKKTSDQGKFQPQIFNVIVPTNPDILPYVISNCIFDFAKYPEKDIADDGKKLCDYDFNRDSNYDLTLKLTDIHAQYWALQEQEDQTA